MKILNMSMTMLIGLSFLESSSLVAAESTNRGLTELNEKIIQSNVKLKKYECQSPGCGKIFSQEAQLITHQKNKGHLPKPLINHSQQKYDFEQIESDSKKEKINTISLEENPGQFISSQHFIDDLLKKPEIRLSDGKLLSVVLDERLKIKLLSEKNLTTKALTDLFMKYFEKTKAAKVSTRVIGFYFALNDEKVYCKTFLGENAK